MDAYDYSQFYQRITVALETIATTFTAAHAEQKSQGVTLGNIRTELQSLNKTQADLLIEQRRWVDRAVNEELGLVMRGREEDLSRAAMIAGLRETDRLAPVIAEMASPTQLPSVSREPI